MALRTCSNEALLPRLGAIVNVPFAGGPGDPAPGLGGLLLAAVVAVVAHGWFMRRIELMTARLESVLADLSRLCAKGPTA